MQVLIPAPTVINRVDVEAVINADDCVEVGACGDGIEGRVVCDVCAKDGALKGGRREKIKLKIKFH